MKKGNNCNEIMNSFLILIGYLEVAKEIESLKDIKEDYNLVLRKIKIWAKDYYLNNSFTLLNHDETLELHNLLEEISYDKIFDKNIGVECEITDSIKIWYEELIMNINKEINNGTN